MAEGSNANLLCCAVCLDVYKDPRTLPCYHSFCASCIDVHMTKHNCDNQFSCPFCRKKCSIPVNGVEGFVRNFYIEAFQQARMSDTVPCNLCGPGSKAEKHCVECDENFCGTCGAMHLKMKMARCHTLQGVDEVNISSCRKHPEVTLVCKKCVIETHLSPRAVTVEHIKDIKLPWDNSVHSIAPVVGNKIWVCLNALENLQLLDRDEKILQSVPIPDSCWFAAADRKGDAIVSKYSPENGLIRASQLGLTSTILSGLKRVKDVACMQRADEHDDIFWTEWRSGGGVMMLRHGQQQPSNILPMSAAYFISCSKHEDLLCVSNLDPTEVVVFRSDGKIVSKYRRGVGDFNPRGLCFDNQGCVIIANVSGKDILRISRDGQLIQTLVEGLSDELHSVSVDEDNYLWVGFSGGKIKVYKMK